MKDRKKERPRAERFVISTCGSVMVRVLLHQGWKMMKQNLFRETWAGTWATPGLVTAGTFTWHSNTKNCHQSSDSRIIHSAALGILGQELLPSAPASCALSSDLEIKLSHHYSPLQLIFSSAQCTVRSGLGSACNNSQFLGKTGPAKL